MTVFTPEVLIGIRWVHFVAGITWIGLLYWFNLVNVPFQRVLDPSVKGQVNPPLFTRALAWFRWSAVVTITAGLLLIYGLYWQDGNLFGSKTEITIFFGGLLGVIMLANVWMVIWPNQRRTLAAMQAGQPPDPTWPRNALFASRDQLRALVPHAVLHGRLDPLPAGPGWGRGRGVHPGRARRGRRDDRAEVPGGPLLGCGASPTR